MAKLIWYLCFFSFANLFWISEASAADTLSHERKKHAFYLMPFNLAGDLWPGFDITWLEIGYNIRITKNQFLGVRIGNIVISNDVQKNIIFSHIDSKKSKGYNFNLEHKIMLRKKLYCSTNLFFQQTTTPREELIGTGQVYLQTHTYIVRRTVYQFLPKLGLVFFGKKHFYFDVGLGFGVKLISSKSINKVNMNDNLEREFRSNKTFDTGTKLIGRFPLQIQMGYCF